MSLTHRVALSAARALGTARRRASGLAFLAGGRDRAAATAGDKAGAPRRRGPFGWFRGSGDDAEEAVGERPRRRLTWPLRLLLIAVFAVPLLLFGVAAWQNYRLVKDQAEQRVTDETAQLHEHTVRALDTYPLVLAWIDDQTRGLGWDRIEHDPELQSFLSDVATLPEIGAVWIVDASGHVRASAGPVPPPPDASTLDAFAEQRQRDAGIFVGREDIGRITRAENFEISRRRSAPNGNFDGVIVVSANPGYFSDFFGTLSRVENFSALLLRSDGSVLVRNPPLSRPLTFSSDTPLMQAIASQPDRGLFWGRGARDGIERLFGYQRIAGHPLYVVFGIPKSGILASWRGNLVDYLLFAIPASLGLFCMTLFAARQLQQQKVASWRWRTTAQRLKREMDRRTRAEAELRQAQKMEALGQLTGGVAHDFNNLLSVLQGCLELLSGRQPDEKLQARVEMALAAIERGEKLTRQLLAFARRNPLAVARVDVNGLLRGMTDLLAQTVGKEIRVVSDFAPDLWPVDTDGTQLELALINLAINARDAMPAGGVLRVRTFNLTLSGQVVEGETSRVGDFVGLEISDTGTGMPPEVLARAFEPFYTSKPPGKGTGLGLSMVYGFARQSGGSTSIRSEVGRGTTVTLLLPRGGQGGASDQGGARDLLAGASA
jgi:two-component system, NtrC family, sensor kinase